MRRVGATFLQSRAPSPDSPASRAELKAEAKYPTASTALSDTKIEISAVSVIAGLFQILDLFRGKAINRACHGAVE
jgi:hypothetical protein